MNILKTMVEKIFYLTRNQIDLEFLLEDNGIIIGGVGSGKSFFVGYMIWSFLLNREDRSVIVVDNGGNYKRLCQFLNGAYYELNSSGNFSVVSSPKEDARKSKSQFTVFDFCGLNDYDKLDPSIFEFLGYEIDRRLQDQSSKKLIVVDECFKLACSNPGGRFLSNLYATSRGYNTAVYSVFQSPRDIISTSVRDVLTANSRVRFVLPLKDGAGLVECLQLNQTEIDLVKNLSTKPSRFAELFFKRCPTGGEGNYSGVFRFAPTRREYWMFMSDPGCIEIENQFRKEHPELNSFQIIDGLLQQEKELVDEVLKEAETQ